MSGGGSTSGKDRRGGRRGEEEQRMVTARATSCELQACTAFSGEHFACI